MHDISVAKAVAGAIAAKIKRKKPKVIEIDLALGFLRFHDPEQVRFWIEEMLKEELGRDLKVNTSISVIEPEIACVCGFRGKPERIETEEGLSHHGIFEMHCPRCGSHDVDAEHGSECLLRSVKIS
jgi:Zn finger protein HypA/HybF involved in hydrogenase expression